MWCAILPAKKFVTAHFAVSGAGATVTDSCLCSSLETPCDAKVCRVGL